MDSDFYVLQHKSWALGNFINCTPAIQGLSRVIGEPVPLLFTKQYVKLCFLDCPFIRRIDEPEGELKFTSDSITRRTDIEDWRYLWETFGPPDKENPPWTYVDCVEPIEERDYIVFVRGSGLERVNYVLSKDPGPKIYLKAAELCRRKGLAVHFVGSLNDLRRAQDGMLDNDIIAPTHIGNIRACLAEIAGCQGIIANDSGLYHAAAALKKKGLILWKNTPFLKNQAPNANLLFSQKEDWEVDLETWMESIR